MKKENPILKDILEDIVECHRSFLSSLGKIKVNSRDQIILKDYSKQLKNQAPWMSDVQKSVINNGDIQIKAPDSLQTIDLNKIINQIKSQPNKKMILIEQFLISISAINEMDRKVILDNLKDLKLEQLENELRTLYETFRT